MPEGKLFDHRPLDLISAAAHDIKTPLVFIRGAASQLNEGHASPEEMARQLGRMEQSAGRLLNLIDSLIGSAQARQQELNLEPVQAEQVIHYALEDIKPYAGELGFDFNLKFSHKLPLILSHRLALRRVLFNLLDNAVKYTRDDSKKTIDVSARRDKDRVRITVRDYGVGIRQEDLKQIWKLFGRAAEPAAVVPGSSGLGLYIASSLSRSLSAELDLTTQAKGTSFYLRLPIAHQLSLF